MHNVTPAITPLPRLTRSPFFGCWGFVAKQFLESPFHRRGVTFLFNFVRLARRLLRCLSRLLFRRGVRLHHRRRQVCLGRSGARLRLGDRWWGLGEEIEKRTLLLRHMSGCFHCMFQIMLERVASHPASPSTLLHGDTARGHLVRGKETHGAS